MLHDAAGDGVKEPSLDASPTNDTFMIGPKIFGKFSTLQKFARRMDFSTRRQRSEHRKMKERKKLLERIYANFPCIGWKLPAASSVALLYIK